MDESKIPIVILNWNNFPDTKECVYSVLDGGSLNFIIYILDNNSEKEDSAELVKAYSNHPRISLRLFDKNLGFAKAHNLILKEIIDEFSMVFMLNNDTYVPKETLKRIENFSFHPDDGMVACKMIDYFNRNLMDNAGHKMLSTGEIIPIGHGEPVSNYQKSIENLGACAGASLYKTSMLKEIGLFDPYFDTGYEDAELGLRAVIAGYKSKFQPDLIVYHKMGQSIKKVFNYQYTLKIQTNIFYTYLKLMPWQIIGIQIIPFIIRYFIIILIDIIFWRPKYLKIQLHSLFIILFKDLGKVLKARKAVKQLRNINWWKLLCLQDFFLKRDIRNFNKFIIKGEKSYFEK